MFTYFFGVTKGAFSPMKEHNDNAETTAIVEAEARPVTPVPNILNRLDIADFSQFIYSTNYGGKPGIEFTAEGVKVLGIREGISTSEVRVEFINDDNTEALFHCTATDRNGDTSSVVVKGKETEHGRVNPNWVSKYSSIAIRNAIKARLPVQLLKVFLQKAIQDSEAKQSAIIESQQTLGKAFAERDNSLGHISKKQFYLAAQNEYGDSEYWDANTWKQVADDLKNLVDWVKAVSE